MLGRNTSTSGSRKPLVALSTQEVKHITLYVAWAVQRMTGPRMLQPACAPYRQPKWTSICSGPYAVDMPCSRRASVVGSILRWLSLNTMLLASPPWTLVVAVPQSRTELAVSSAAWPMRHPPQALRSCRSQLRLDGWWCRGPSCMGRRV